MVTMTKDDVRVYSSDYVYISSGLNYKHLIDGCHEPLDVIQPILNQENVPTIAKLSSNIRDKVKIIFYTK